MDFYVVLTEINEYKGETYTPYASKNNEGDWEEGSISIDFLNTHFGEFDNVDDMIIKSETFKIESLILYFKWLKSEGVLT